MQGVEGHHGAVQVQRFQELSEMAGLVVLDVDLKVVQEVAAVLGGAEEVDRQCCIGRSVCIDTTR
jgi:hypothetical protein